MYVNYYNTTITLFEIGFVSLYLSYSFNFQNQSIGSCYSLNNSLYINDFIFEFEDTIKCNEAFETLQKFMNNI